MPRNPLLGFQNPTAYAVAFKNIPEKNRCFVPLKKYLHGFLEEMLRDKKLSIRLSEEIKSTNSSFFPVSASIVKKTVLISSLLFQLFYTLIFTFNCSSFPCESRNGYVTQ